MSFLGSLGSSLFGTVTNALAGHWSAKQNAGLSRANWTFAQSNAHQLEAQDLAKAGLNPILSATNSQIAGMGSVSGNSVSDNGLGASATNASVQKYLKGIDAEIEGKKLDNDLKRINIENENLKLQKWLSEHQAKNLDADSEMKSSQTGVNNAQVVYLREQTNSLHRLTSAQIDSIYNHMNNESALTSAQISEIESKKSVNLAQIKALEAQAKDAIEHSNLTYWQKLDIVSDINSASRKLRNLTDQQRYEYLTSSLGDVQNQASFGLSLMNPFTNFGMRVGSGYVGSRK